MELVEKLYLVGKKKHKIKKVLFMVGLFISIIVSYSFLEKLKIFQVYMCFLGQTKYQKRGNTGSEYLVLSMAAIYFSQKSFYV